MAKKKTDRIDKREGIEMYGLHFEYITFTDPPNPETGLRLRSQVQLFTVGHMVYSYERYAGQKTARWKSHQFDTHQGAIESARAILNNAASASYSTEMIGVPTLVQLAESDATAVRHGLKPSARFDGGLRNVRLHGKIVDNEWKPGRRAE